MNLQKSLLQNLLNIKYIPQRTCTKNILKEHPEGIKYYGFTYYPRSSDFKDPPYKPSKLFLIKRIKSMKGTDYKEKRTLGFLNIDGDNKHFGHINVVKNIPTINALLWKVKHLVEVRPITWKGELPPLEESYSGTNLRTTGELIVIPKLKPKPEQLQLTDKIKNDPNKLKRHYLKKHLKDKWLNPFYGSV